MTIAEVNESIIGRRVRGIHNGFEVTGYIIDIVEDEYTKGVRIRTDKPVFFCTGYGVQQTQWYESEYDSTGRKFDGWGNLQHTEFIPYDEGCSHHAQIQMSEKIRRDYQNAHHPAQISYVKFTAEDVACGKALAHEREMMYGSEE